MHLRRCSLVVILLVVASCRSTEQQPTSTSTTPHAPATNAQAVQAPQPVAPKTVFKSRIEHVSMYPVPNNPTDLAVSLVVSVYNSGKTSQAKRWNLEVITSDRSLPSGLSPVQVNGVVELPGSGSNKVDLGKEDLAIRTSETPIATGTNIEGVLTFVLPKTSERDLVNKNGGFVVHFRDEDGNTFQTPKIVVGRKKSEAAAK